MLKSTASSVYGDVFFLKNFKLFCVFKILINLVRSKKKTRFACFTEQRKKIWMILSYSKPINVESSL